MDKGIWIAISSPLRNGLFFKKCKDLNKKLHQLDRESFLYTKDNLPHLNLYDLNIPKKNLSKVVEELTNKLAEAHSLKIRIGKIKYFSHGVFFIAIRRDKLLATFHKDIVKTISKYKGSCICNYYLKRKNSYSRKQRLLLRKYGNPFVLSEFKPHITIGFIKDISKRCKIKSQLSKVTFQGGEVINSVQIVTERYGKITPKKKFILK